MPFGLENLREENNESRAESFINFERSELGKTEGVDRSVSEIFQKITEKIEK